MPETAMPNASPPNAAPPAFALDDRLSADAIAIGDLPLCRVLMKDDSRFPWLVLVPRRAEVSEILDLSESDRTQAFAEMMAASTVLREAFRPDKLNVAALGNMVRQLHIHVIARFHSDAAWPSPTFGFGEPVPFPAHALGVVAGRIATALKPYGLSTEALA